MSTTIAMPKLGMTMKEGTVINWPVPIGERVERGQIVLIIESEKAEVEIESTGSGTFRHIYVEPDELVPCGTLLGVLTETPDEDFDADAFAKAYEAEQGGPPAAAAKLLVAPTAKVAGEQKRSGKSPVTPAARKVAKRLGVDAAEISGTGPGGRVTKEDVEAYAERRKSLVTVAEGVALDVPSEGEGAPVVLLPGFGTDVSAFARQIPALAEHYAVRGVNPRGVGVSDAPELDVYDVATTAADVAALIEDSAHVVGTSLGAAAALELAIAHPDKVRSLTLIAPLVTVTGRLEAVSEAWCVLAAAAEPDVLARSLLPWFFGADTLASASGRDRIARGLATTVAQVAPEVLVRMRAGMLAWSGTREAELGQIAVPTLVIVAGDDLLTTGGEAIAAAISGARCEVIAGAGHAVGLEAADVVNELVIAHLSGVR